MEGPWFLTPAPLPLPLFLSPNKPFEVLEMVKREGGAMFVTDSLMMGVFNDVVKKREELPLWIIKEKKVSFVVRDLPPAERFLSATFDVNDEFEVPA